MDAVSIRRLLIFFLFWTTILACFHSVSSVEKEPILGALVRRWHCPEMLHVTAARHQIGSQLKSSTSIRFHVLFAMCKTHQIVKSFGPAFDNSVMLAWQFTLLHFENYARKVNMQSELNLVWKFANKCLFVVQHHTIWMNTEFVVLMKDVCRLGLSNSNCDVTLFWSWCPGWIQWTKQEGVDPRTCFTREIHRKIKKQNSPTTKGKGVSTTANRRGFWYFSNVQNPNRRQSQCLPQDPSFHGPITNKISWAILLRCGCHFQ